MNQLEGDEEDAFIRSTAEPSPFSQHALVKQLTLSNSYDHNVRPVNPLGGPLIVFSRMYIFSIQTKKNMLRWQDVRLAYCNISLYQELVGQRALLDMIWKPHVFLSNERETDHIDELVSVLPQGEVLFTSRIKTTILCYQNEGHFPFDHSTCKLILDTWRYNSEHLSLQWEDKEPVLMPDGTPSLTEYKLMEVRPVTTEDVFIDHVRKSHTRYLCKNKTEEDAINSTENLYCNVYTYSSLSLQLIMSREFGFYFWDHYLPSVFIVIVSWLTFWVNPNEVSARPWIATSTMLSFFALGTMNNTVPKLTQFKTHDIWFVVCTLFILFSLFEFAFVNIVHRQQLKNHEMKKLTSKNILKTSLRTEHIALKELHLGRVSPEPGMKNKMGPSPRQSMQEQRSVYLDVPLADFSPTRQASVCTTDSTVQSIQMTNVEMANWIDKRSRIVFPVAFFVFNVFYWILMLT